MAFNAAALARRRRFGGAGVSFTYYVDSVNGNDANDGMSRATAFATPSAASTAVADGESIGFARGSTFEQTFTVANDSITLGVYGDAANPMPVFDGSRLIEGTWTNVSGNIWSIAWTREAAGAGVEPLGFWADDVRPTYVTPYTSMTANGQWSTSSLTAASSTLYIYSTTNPNSNGVAYRAGYLKWGINSHPTTIGSDKTVTATGPFELKRFLASYNAAALGAGSFSKMLLRDGTNHHSVTAAALNEFIFATEYSPQQNPAALTAYRAAGAGFNPVFRKCGVVLGGGATRPAGASAFYAHATTPSNAASFTIDMSFSIGCTGITSAADAVTVTDFFSQDIPASGVGIGIAGGAYTINRFLFRDSTVGNSNIRPLRRLTTVNASITNAEVYSQAGFGYQNQASTGGTSTLTQSTIYANGSIPLFGGGTIAMTKTILWSAASRAMDQLSTGYSGDYNVFYRGNDADGDPGIYWNGALYNDAFSAFTAASGHDANSVSCRPADQVRGNSNAFWLGVANDENDGPPDGDFRINPNARVYDGSRNELIGTFADGTTLITEAGAQQHTKWDDYSIASGPTTRWPTLPASVADLRLATEGQYNFYP